MEDIEIPGTAAGDLLLSPASGGDFEGPDLRGSVVPIGFGTTYTRGKKNDIHSECLLKTDDGCDILMEMDAFYDVTPDVEERLIRGEKVDPAEYYYKCNVSFHTGTDRYKWLERKVCIAECIISDYTKLRFEVYMAV